MRAARLDPALDAARKARLAGRAGPCVDVIGVPPFVCTRHPRRLALSGAHFGGGTMGAGITAACQQAGPTVTLIERDSAALEKGRENLRAIYAGSVARGRMSADVLQQRVGGVKRDHRLRCHRERGSGH